MDKSIRQYHEAKIPDGKGSKTVKRTEYVLGVLPTSAAWATADADDSAEPDAADDADASTTAVPSWVYNGVATPYFSEVCSAMTVGMK